VKDPREAAHVGAGAVPHLLVPVVHDPGLPLAVERVRRRQRDVEPLRRVGARARPVGAPAVEELARPVPAPAVHRQEVVGREEAPRGDEDEQPGGGPAGILPPAHPRQPSPQPATRGRGAPLLLSSRARRRRRAGRSREPPGSLCRGSGVEQGESLAGSGMIGIALGRVKLRDRAREYCREGIGGGEGEGEARAPTATRPAIAGRSRGPPPRRCREGENSVQREGAARGRA